MANKKETKPNKPSKSKYVGHFVARENTGEIVLPTTDIQEERTERIAPGVVVVGAGFVGLATAYQLQCAGHQCVTVLDVNYDRIQGLLLSPEKVLTVPEDYHWDSEFLAGGLGKGSPALYSDNDLPPFNLNGIVFKHVLNEDIINEVNNRIVFVCVPTPPEESGTCDISQVTSVMKYLKGASAIVVKSTVPMDAINDIMACAPLEQNPITNVVSPKSFYMPEFLRQKTYLSDSLNKEKIIIGTGGLNPDGAALDLVCDALGISRADAEIMSYVSAACVKYASNALLATRLTVLNACIRIAKQWDISGNLNPEQVARAIGLDERIGEQYLTPSVGWYGACFPKDLLALHHQYNTLTEQDKEVGFGGETPELFKDLYSANVQGLAFWAKRAVDNIIHFQQKCPSEILNIHIVTDNYLDKQDVLLYYKSLITRYLLQNSVIFNAVEVLKVDSSNDFRQGLHLNEDYSSKDFFIFMQPVNPESSCSVRKNPRIRMWHD